MEVYRNSRATDRQILLEFPDAVADPAVNSIDVFVLEEGEGAVAKEINSVTLIPGEGFLFTIPLYLVQEDKTLQVHWDITFVEDGETYITKKSMPVNVVTPILSKREIKEVWDSATDAEVTAIEKAVRHIIQAHTGQDFGMWTGSLNVKADGSGALLLPRRLLSLSSVNGHVPDNRYSLSPSGYVLRYYPWGVPPVKADYDGLHMHTGGVIHNPNNVRLGEWTKDRNYKITGQWGWDQIPEAVREAAKLLVNDYACSDAQYRDRYLQSMTAADWRIQFNAGAYVRTGNVRADQLLEEYVIIRGWGVI